MFVSSHFGSNQFASSHFGGSAAVEAFSGGYFPFVDRPPTRKKKEKVRAIIKKIIPKLLDQTVTEQEIALRLAIVRENIKFNELYFELLKTEIKRRKRRRKKAIILLLTGDG